MKNIVLTFDYELYFQESGTPERCLLQPTTMLLNVMARIGARATFFVDVLYLQRLADIAAERDRLKRIREQLNGIITAGHRIELHLHPHWRDAIYADGRWKFPTYERYKLQSLPESEIENLFVVGAENLTEIARETDRTYRLESFRAGGFLIEPFSPLRAGFVRAGIRLDSSVVSGLYVANTGGFADFRGAPQRELYRFSESPLKMDEYGDLWELPIGSVSKRWWLKAADRLLCRVRRGELQRYGDGSGMPGPKTGFWHRNLRRFGEREMLDMNRGTFLQWLWHTRHSPASLLTFVGHPKMCSPMTGTLLERWATAGLRLISTRDVLCELAVPPSKSQAGAIA